MKRLFLIVGLVCLLASTAYSQIRIPGPGGRSPGGSGGTVTLGENSQSGADSGNANFILFTPFITPSGGSGFTVSDLQVYFTSVTNAQWGTALYTDTGDGTGRPNTRLCQTSVTNTPTNNAFNSLVPGSCGTLSASTMYWIGQLFASGSDGNGNVSSLCAGTPAQSIYQSQGSFAFPATMSGSFNLYGGGCVSQYVVLTCVGACGSAPTVVSGIQDFEDSTNGTTITPSLLGTRKGGCQPGAWGGNTSPLTGMTYSTGAQQTMNSTQNICGSSMSGSGTRGLNWSTSATPPVAISFAPSFTLPSTVSMSFEVTIDFDTTGDLSHAYSLGTISNGANDYINPQIINGTLSFEPKSGGVTGPSISANTQYCVSLQYNAGGTHHMAIFHNGTQVGSTMNGAAVGNFVPSALTNGITGAEGEVTGHNIKIDNWRWDIVNGTFPLACN